MNAVSSGESGEPGERGISSRFEGAVTLALPDVSVSGLPVAQAVARVVGQAAERALLAVDDLSLALARAHSLERLSDGVRARGLAQEVGRARSLAGRLVRGIAEITARPFGERDAALRGASSTVDVDGLALTRALVDGFDLTRALDRAEAVATALLARIDATPVDEPTRKALALAVRMGEDLARARIRSRDLLHLLGAVRTSSPPQPAPVADEAAPPEPVAVTARPGALALQLSGFAARMLPAALQLRFEEELLDELYALAESDAPRHRQLACALRQLAAVPRLRTLKQVEKPPLPTRAEP